MLDTVGGKSSPGEALLRPQYPLSLTHTHTTHPYTHHTSPHTQPPTNTRARTYDSENARTQTRTHSTNENMSVNNLISVLSNHMKTNKYLFLHLVGSVDILIYVCV